MEIVQEEGHDLDPVPVATQSTRTLSSASQPSPADDSDDDMLNLSSPVTMQQCPLETEDDDEPLLQFDETGVSQNRFLILSQ